MAETLFLLSVSLLWLGIHEAVRISAGRLFHSPILTTGTVVLCLIAVPGWWILWITLAVLAAGMKIFFSTDRRQDTHFLLLLMLLMTAGLSLNWEAGAAPVIQAYRQLLNSLIQTWPALGPTRVMQALYTFWVYLEYLPAALAFVFWTGLIKVVYQEEYPLTTWYRWALHFDHRWAIPALGSLAAGFAVYQAGKGDQWGLLVSNLALLMGMVYALLGYQLLLIWLRKKKWPELPAVFLLYCLLVLTGPYFLFVLVLYFGIGISDSWMHYRRT